MAGAEPGTDQGGAVIDPTAFAVGMHALCVAFNREATPDLRDVYATSLSRLTTEQFQSAVAAVIETERFFPAPAVLIEHAARVGRREYIALPPARTEEQRQIDRAASRRMLDVVQAAYRERVRELPPAPVATVPRETLVEASDERIEELRRQAELLLAEERRVVAGTGDR